MIDELGAREIHPPVRRSARRQAPASSGLARRLCRLAPALVLLGMALPLHRPAPISAQADRPAQQASSLGHESVMPAAAQREIGAPLPAAIPA
ncbi:MAG TPA: hypothetical protein VHB98_14615, partial [Chloroflexota bacterium]|nr:hypothetical protein [Chloroflexota bacterium]